MIKCLQCTLQRTLVQQTILRTLRTSNHLNTDKRPEKETSDTDTPKGDGAISNFPEEFRNVFKFPYIGNFALVNRMKLYQTGITGLLTSGALVLNQLDYVSTDMCQMIVIVGIAACIPLYICGYLTGNFIGYIYYNEKTNMVRIAYADQWGRRKDIESPADDIVPLEDLPVTRYNHLWFTFRRYSTNDTLRINTKYAIIVDREALKKII